MLTWRYHLLSLVAVFLSLGLGILTGVSLSDNGVIETGETGLVNDIQRDVDDLRSQNNALGRERSTNIRYQDDTFPFLITGRLQGKKIALVCSNKAGDDLQRKLGSAINGAGGQVLSTTVLMTNLEPAFTAARLKSELKNDPAFAGLDESSVLTVVGQQVAKEVSGKGAPLKVLPALQGSVVESMSGNYETAVDAVVLVTRADEEQSPAYQELEKRLLLSIKERELLAVGTEPADAPLSEIPLFLSVDVSSVDNLDSRIGQVSLVYVLGGEKGAFGVKTTADMLIPILRTSRQPSMGATP